MSKTLLTAAICLAAVQETAWGKVRPLYPSLDGFDQSSVVKSHERIVREPLVNSCSHAMVGASNEPVVGAGSCASQCLF